ncbi:kinase-like domain-containing protein [Boeremia exigua]|uniref:kinase-like domain-containing protein n=1 Tax=Boeremia exigua TaxID=749465 RepID=UPI001E8DD4CA|nr:kinase-like domain-containing protein [Boeremia exigua]KAH6622109.1 kinase-like domain-containing protein [Boeremia exigua]
MPLPPRTAALTRAVGQSGRRYLVEQILQDKPGNQGRVYLATSGSQKFVLKSVPPKDFTYFKDMFDDLRYSSCLRVPEDTIPEHSMFAYRYLRDNLLTFFQQDVALPTTKRVMGDVLRGIAALHEKGVVHTDIKPDNILVDWEKAKDDIIVEQVQIADIESGAYVPEGSVIQGRQLGNWMWRSPEAHMSGPMSKPTDIFSFGIMCIYALTKDVIFAVDKKQLPADVQLEDAVIQLQISYFADLDGVRGLVDYYGDSHWAHYIVMVANEFTTDNPRRPFDTRRDLEPEFKDLIMRLMNVDPRRRLTAKEALAHTWFAEQT